MSDALKRAYASASETPILTLEIAHEAITTVKLAQSYAAIITYDGTFASAAISEKLPDKNTEGDQALLFSISNLDNAVMYRLSQILTYNREVADAIATCTLRHYLPSDIVASPTSATASGPVIELIITSASINWKTATITAKYSPLPNVSFPKRRYFTSQYTGLRYA